jgi:hypothetical protein
MTDELDPDGNDNEKLDLSAWEAPPPPSNLADAVIARMAGGVTPNITDEAPPRRRRTWLIAGVAAACLALTAGTYALVQGTRRAAPTSGSLVAERAQTLSLETARAELDPGARVSWRREGGALHVEQSAGNVAWRVDGGERLLIDAGAMVASVEATGASLRVEVKMNQTDARVIGGAALTAAAVSIVTIVVYEGHVKVSGSAGQPTVIVQPGSTYTVSPPGPRLADPPVVGSSVPIPASDADAPTLADVRLRGNESATIHTPTLPARIEFEVPPGCTLDAGPHHNAGLIVELDGGVHPYQINCGDTQTARGTISVRQDDASAPLSTADQPTVHLKTDGGSHNVSVVNRTPRIEVTGGTGTLHVVAANVDRTFDNGVIPEGALEAGTYRYWFDPAKPSTLDILPNTSAPVLHLAEVSWVGDQVGISGDALTYSQLSVRSMNVPLDISGRFSMGVSAQNVFALRLAHPNRGVHYFVVRAPKQSTVAVAPSTVDVTQLMAIMNAAKPKLLACAKQGAPGKRGKVVLVLAIAPAGHVDKASVSESYDSPVSECMLGVTKFLRFPKASGSTSFKFPLMVENPGGGTTGCDAEASKEDGMRLINEGQHASALVMFEQSLKCKDDPYVRQLAFMEACASSNAKKAKLFYKQLSPDQQTKFAQICKRQRPPVPYEDKRDLDAAAIADDAGYLQVNSKPAGAKILIDGSDTGLTTPISGKKLKLPAGKHKVTFVIGVDRFTYPVVIEAGESATMTKDLQ